MMMLKPSRNSLLAALLVGVLVGCDSLDELLGAESRQQQPLPGDRIAVLSFQNELQIDPVLREEPIRIMQPQLTKGFAFETAAQQAGVDNLAVDGFEVRERTRVGDGEGWELPLVQQPVVGGEVVYAMDGAGVISAHRADAIDEVAWRYPTNTNEDAPDVPGGGLAYADGVVYATTGYGSVVALVASDGSLLWRAETQVPIRSAPLTQQGKTFVVTIDNQLLAYHARTGRLLWTHRGIKESAVYLGTVTPVLANGIVVVAYSSGELYALSAEDGTPLWSDTLIANKRTSATAALTGIDATPLIRDGLVYAISNSGLMVANRLSNGSGLWDLELTGYHTPWIGGDYVFVLTSDQRLMAIHRVNRGVKWITELQRTEKDKDVTPAFSEPVMVNNSLFLLNDQGEGLFFDPQDGTLQRRIELPDEIYTTPVISGGSLYLIDRDATLYRLQ